MIAAMRGFLLLVASAHFLSDGGPRLHRTAQHSCDQSGMVHHASPSALQGHTHPSCDGCPTAGCAAGACGITSPAALSPMPPWSILGAGLALTLPPLPTLRTRSLSPPSDPPRATAQLTDNSFRL